MGQIKIRELQWFDMAINYTKSNCHMVGARLDAKCTEIVKCPKFEQ